MESRYSTMIENAFYYSNPPEVQQVAKKVRPPMHEYIRKLLYKDLSKVTTEKVIYIVWNLVPAIQQFFCQNNLLI